jgi:adenylosuccinate lyase
VERLEEQMRLLFNIPFAAKLVEQQETTMHTVAYPQIDWKNLREFC